MLEDIKDLSLPRLNEVTQAWLQVEYHQSISRELGVTPARKYLDTKHVLRPAPALEEIRMAFRKRMVRTQRKTDGTVSIEGKRFEVPQAFRTFKQVVVHYAPWDLGLVHIVDQRTGAVLARIIPVDKSNNASSERRKLTTAVESPPQSGEEPPLLRQILEQYAATGIPPSYIPKDDNKKSAGTQ
jgi:hypothetical protein